jgi:hypothetical protein
MDKRPAPAEEQLLHEVLNRLPALGLAGEVLAREPRTGQAVPEPDFEIRLGRGKEAVTYFVEVKRHLRPNTLGAVLMQLRPLGEKGMLIADYVTPQMADTLKAQKVAFADAAGNAYIERRNWFVWVKGEKPADTVHARAPRGRAFQASGLRVLFALLCRPELAAENYRTIARAAGVAHGTVGWVMAELPALGFLAEVGGKRRLLQAERLLAQWAEAYARLLRPKLTLGQYRRDVGDIKNWQEQFDAAKHGAAWGGEVAAARLTKYLRPETTTLYVQRRDAKLLHDARLKADPAGDIELLEHFWAFDNKPIDLAPDILIYADLLATGDARCLEAAQLLQEDILARFDRQG